MKRHINLGHIPNQREFGLKIRSSICFRMIVAEREIWLTISRMLWAFFRRELPDELINLKEYDGLLGRSPVPSGSR